MSKKLTGVLICLPAFGSINYVQTTQSLFTLGQWLTHMKVPSSLGTQSCADIVHSRNVFLTTWYDQHPELSHLLFVDADMEFSLPLIRDMLAFEKPLVGCYYAKRQFPAVAVGRSLKQETVADIKDGFIKVAGMGGGVMLITRIVVERMLKQMPEISDENVADHPGCEGFKRLIRAFEPFTHEGTRLSEDLAFCQRWRDCGGEVWANVNHLIGHIGTFNFAIRYADGLETKAAEVKLGAEVKPDAPHEARQIEAA